jgi:hypothetical protein
MNKRRRWQCGSMVGLGLLLMASVGCQTNTSGMTLPTGRYLQHPPQYIPPSPPYPFPREQAAMEAANLPARQGAVPEGLPPQVPGGGAVPPAGP